MNKSIIIAIIAVILIIIIVGAYFAVQQAQKYPTNGQDEQQNTASKTEMIQGMKVEILTEGSGAQTKQGDKVTVNYVGTLENGTKFDSSIDRGEPFVFTLGENRVIQGWELGVVGMRVGEKRRLTVPPEMGYGAQAVGGVIPANSTLVFEIDMLKIGE